MATHDPTRALPTVLRALAAGAGGGLVLLLALGHRTDYVGHYLAGFGGTLGLLAVPLATLRSRLRWEPFAVACVAVAIGAVLEATLFNLAMFDPVDFCNQSLGAVLAAASVQGRVPALVAAAGSAGLALLFLSLGAVLAFA